MQKLCFFIDVHNINVPKYSAYINLEYNIFNSAHLKLS